MISLTEIQTIGLAAMFISIVVASWKQQFQALFYLLAVLYVCNDYASFALANFLLLVGLLGSGFIRGSTKS